MDTTFKYKNQIRLLFEYLLLKIFTKNLLPTLVRPSETDQRRV